MFPGGPTVLAGELQPLLQTLPNIIINVSASLWLLSGRRPTSLLGLLLCVAWCWNNNQFGEYIFCQMCLSMLESVCDRAKPRECTDDFLFFRYECPVFDHSQLWSTAKEHLHLHSIKCPADRAIMGSSGARQSKGFTRTPCILWCRQHWTVCSDRQANFVQAVHGGKKNVIEALCTLCDEVDVSEDLQLTLAKFVCTAYRPKGTQLSSISELRWHLFCKYMTESEMLPPNLGALKQLILRARVQATVLGRLQFPSRNCWTPGEWIPQRQRWQTAGQPPLMSQQHLSHRGDCQVSGVSVYTKQKAKSKSYYWQPIWCCIWEIDWYLDIRFEVV